MLDASVTSQETLAIHKDYLHVFLLLSEALIGALIHML